MAGARLQSKGGFRQGPALRCSEHVGNLNFQLVSGWQGHFIFVLLEKVWLE